MFSVPRAALFAVALAAGLSSASAQQVTPPVPTLSLSATGTVTAVPDTAIITVGVVSEGETAGAALTENTAAMRKLIDEVLASGVPDRYVVTSGFRIEPRMVFPEPREDGTQDAPRIVGYRVDNSVTVRIRELAKAGTLLDKVVQLGANQVQGIVFVVDDEAPLLDKARAEAVKAASDKADVYARAAGIKLKRILSITEQPDVQAFGGPLRRMSPAAADAVPLQPGEQDISVTVSVAWEIE
jgi:uncharacterized protein YggE